MPIAIFSAASGGDMRAASLWVCLICGAVAGHHSAAELEDWHAGESGAALAMQRRQWLRWCLGRNQVRRSKVQTELHFRSMWNECWRPFALQVLFSAGKGAVGLLGTSGAGKSMTLRMIAGIVRPIAGVLF